MLQFSDLKIETAVANRSGTTEADTMSKHGRSSKCLTSRKNFLTDYLNFVGMVIIIAFMTTCGQAKQKNMQNVNPTNWKTLEQRDYTIKYPDSFELNVSGKMGTSFLLFLKQGSINEMFRENINLIIQDLKGLNISLDGFVEISENQIKTLITDGLLIESKRFKKDNSEFHELIYTGKQGIYELKWKQYFTIKNEKAYILTLTTEVEQFETYKTVGEEIMNSFKLK